jgi:hypothetical protein
MTTKALSKRFNKVDNILHIQLFDNGDHTFDVYDSSFNQKIGDVVTLQEVDTLINGWVGKLKINKTFYEKAL